VTQTDLHVHSTFSDGLLSPQELCALAHKKHIRVIALCDHDTMDGLASMRAEVAKLNERGGDLRLIPSVELSTGPNGNTHILGYGAHPDSAPLQEAIAMLRQNRASRGRAMLEALARQGIRIPPERLPADDAPGRPLGRPHVARALVSMGAVTTVEQAFQRYLTPGKPAYVPLEHLSTQAAVALLVSAGAVPVLAHPMRMNLPPHLLEALIGSLIPLGLMGLEVFHPSASRGDVRMLETMARRLRLLVTGGSDFHGDRGARAKLGGLPSGWAQCTGDVEALLAAIAAQAKTPDSQLLSH